MEAKASNQSIIKQMVGVGIDLHLNEATISHATKTEQASKDLSDEDKTKIKQNAVKKMKQINTVIKDFTQNIDHIKQQMD